MSRREDIDNDIWVDPDFAALTPDAKLLYLWSFTNPSCNMSGLYKIGLPAFEFGTGLSRERVAAALSELQSAGEGFALYVDQLLWVRSRVKHLRSRSPQMAKAIANDLMKVRIDHPLRVKFLSKYGSDKWLRDALKGTYPDRNGNLSEKPVGKADSDRVTRPSREGPGKGDGSSSTTTTIQVPGSFPRELEPHLDAVFAVLVDLAERHSAKAVSRLSLASVLMAPDRRHKPFVRAAHDYAAWADGKAERRKDVVSGYRNWLDKQDDAAGVESIGVATNGRQPINSAVPEYLRPSPEWTEQLEAHLANQGGESA